ncbi:uncharacterized protein LOC127660363 [Xyrauchen texanus]|uniref:uncharacterized protein LOC127660363 n=1 Tax=Xyrauchen texanus TaxID=154827 RepID=UPI0022427EDE|nr:uncharacterized protein LOC127660363 [Xyrauchen texanus]
MANKPKVHVFLGAPCPQILALEVQEKGLPQWKTMDLTWSQGRLIPKSNVREEKEVNLSIEVSGRLHSAVTPERVPFSETSKDQKEISQDDSTPSDCQCSKSNGESIEEEELCPLSVTEYLDGYYCPQTCLVVGQSKDERPQSPLSMETEYLSTWTKSQILLLQGRLNCSPTLGFHGDFGSPHTPRKQTSSASISSPELYSPVTSPEERGLGGTLHSSLEWHNDSQIQRLQSRGVILEITADGILCSQGNAIAHSEKPVDNEEIGLNIVSSTTIAQTSPSPSTSKRIKLSQTVDKTKEVTEERTRTNAVPLSGPTTLLAKCKTQGVRYAILVAVVHPCQLKEIKVKTGASAGTSVPLATVIVTDQSDMEMKLVLWRAAAFWALTVYPGDILLITDVRVHIDKWKTEIVLQSSFTSKLLNLGQVTGEHCPQAPQNLNCQTLRTLCTHLCEKRPLMVSLPPRKPQDLHSIPFVRLGALRPDTLVNALVRVKHRNLITAWRDEAQGTSRTGGVLKAVLNVEQGDGHQGAVVLWGAALSWLQRLERNKAAVWEFRMLLVRQDVTSGLLELHSTPWGSCQPLFPDDNRCKEFYSTACSERTANSFEIDLNTLLSQKYSGDVEVRVKITAFQFQSSPSQEDSLFIDGNTPLERILDIVSGDIIFTGCGKCSIELQTDENGIYRPCYPCLPHTGVRHYFRPVVLTVRDGDNQISVEVPPVLVQKILLNTPPEKLHKTVAPASEVRFIQVVANRISSMLTTMENTFLLTVRSHFQVGSDDQVHRMAGALRMDDTQYAMKFDSEFIMDLPYMQTPFEVKTEPYVPETVHGPYLQIIEEPKQRGFRFRYECEGPSHGGLPGASSERNRRTYPTVKVSNYVGHARVEVQLVTHTEPPRVHAHSLVGRQCNDSGICTVDVGPNDLTAQFSNLGILHVTKKGVAEVLTKRLREEKGRMKEPGYKFTEAEEQAIVQEAKELGKAMDLNIVRLKFTAYLQDSNGGFTRSLKPVVSNPIYDSKSPNASNLKISRMDKTSGSVLGGEEVFLLCDKVQKDDIYIRFYEEEEDGGWEAFGDFSPTDVHKQYAIVFKTPPYRCTDISRPVTVFLQLRRKKGGDCSEPKQFTYIPHNQDKEEVQRKRMKALPQPYDHWRGGPQGGPGGFGGPGAGAGAGAGTGGGGGGMGGGFQYNHPMDGSGFYVGGCGGGFGGGAQMSGSNPQTNGSNKPTNKQSQTGSPMQQQLIQIATALQNHATLTAKCTARALLEYCSTGDVRPLVVLQRHLCGVQDENGDTPLHLAIIHQQPVVVQQLIQAMMKMPQQKFINKFNNLSQTPLHLAVITKQTKIVEMLMKAGADPSTLDRDGRTALHLAAHTGDEALLQVVLGLLGEQYTHLVNCADFSGQYPVHLAVRKDGERCLQLLVDAGARINMPEQKSGCTALHLAVRDNLLKVACNLITELKADVNACTYGGNSPLHIAASQGSPPLCSMLVAAGADKRLENDEPLFFSSSSSDEDDESEINNVVDKQPQDFMVQQVQRLLISSERCAFNPRKRPAAGHTPFDLAKCQKVRDLLDGRKGPKPSSLAPKRTKISTEEVSQGLDSEVLTKLCSILTQDHVPWRELAEKLGMLTLTHLYQESPSPCHKLLENYQLSGGPVDGLVEALQSLGVSEGVRLLRDRQPREDKQSTDSTEDSGFGSQSIGEEITNPAIANH